jgi:hypothetical protein
MNTHYCKEVSEYKIFEVLQHFGITSRFEGMFYYVYRSDQTILEIYERTPELNNDLLVQVIFNPIRITFYKLGDFLEKSQNGWIDLKDELPENYKMVLLFDRNGIQMFGYLENFKNGKTVRVDNLANPVSLDSFTHWMPLPKGPEL